MRKVAQLIMFKFPMVLEEETQQKLEISSEKTTRNGKFPFHTSEIKGNCAFPLSFHGENYHEILIFFAMRLACLSLYVGHGVFIVFRSPWCHPCGVVK